MVKGLAVLTMVLFCMMTPSKSKAATANAQASITFVEPLDIKYRHHFQRYRKYFRFYIHKIRSTYYSQTHGQDILEEYFIVE